MDAAAVGQGSQIVWNLSTCKSQKVRHSFLGGGAPGGGGGLKPGMPAAGPKSRR